MYTYRNVIEEDFVLISAFPENKMEQFYMFPSGTFPLDPVHLFEVSQTRALPTVIESDGSLAAYCNLYDLSAGDHGWLGNVIVNPAYRGKGAGRYLIEVMIEKARNELKLKELHLVCHNSNTKALLLYNKLGFCPYGMKIMNGHDGHEIVGIKMKLPLY
ncbi:GNAT family N-acetyltransferase [Paenibacillus albiflavus]|uniref:GNAT family N-acetyltransferase n=1 Tax=Paenibacillus albiflavus TaxID=2545760 RepID=A0A4R4ELJ1_9BACL|nr:GNAT family N-acetyltransferase [Paenibacillus albiflavus]TCZ80879.1 GNAT family N-acetyltransferase [Paenibacillus albiflavus]